MYSESIWLNVPRSRVRVEELSSERAGQICGLHYHDEIELLLICAGAVSCTVDGREYRADVGEILFVNTRVPHYTSALTDHVTYLLLQFRPESYPEDGFLSDLRVLHLTGQKPADAVASPDIAEAIKRIFDESNRREKAYDYMIRSEVYRILCCLTRLDVLPPPGEGFDSAGFKKVRPALEYIDKNYATPITLGEISRQLGLNPAYFCRIFRSATGSTFTEYLSYVRVRKSEALLRESAKSITDVSMDVGFSSVTYYNRVFKKIMNCTPTVYRKLRYRNE